MPKSRSINLALQGGGAHGAFTWGVLDRLLEDEGIAFSWISASSAGAVNAVALAAGLATGSRAAAREKLYSIWHAIHNAGVPDLTRLNPFLNGLATSKSLTQMASLWSPYEFNPLGFDPLRRVLTEHVDFDLIRSASPVELLICATHVGSGRARFFQRAELTIESVLASACLPALHHAVEVGGEAYWDGGFSANPDLVSLASTSPCQDTLLVTIMPREQTELPVTARDISNHTARLAFSAPLIRDIEIIQALRMTANALTARGALVPLIKHRFHLIDGGPVTSALHPETSLKPEWSMMTYLHGAGRDHASTWIDANWSSVGHKQTASLEDYFLPAKGSGFRGEAKPKPRKPRATAESEKTVK